MKNVRRILGLALVVALVVSAFAGCGGKKTDTSKFLNVMLSTNVMSLDTNLATDGESFEVISSCVGGLTRMNAEGAPEPNLAKEIKVSEDGKTYTITLRDVKWSNGKALTANDFVFAWQRMAAENEEYGYMLSDCAQIKNAAAIGAGEADRKTLGVKATDDKTLVVELDVPVSYFESLLYFPTFFPINEEFFNSIPKGKTYATSPDTFLCCGAYTLEDYIPGATSITLKKNPEYWDAANVKNEGIKYQVVGSSDNALTAFKAGTLDVVTVSGSQVDAVKKDAALKDKLLVTGAGYMWYLTFSQTAKNANGYLANANLRLALTNAIDREALVNNFVMDGSLATYTAVPPQFAPNAIDGSDFSANQERFKDVCSYNPTKAAEYLAKAKAELGVDTFTFTMIYGNNEGDEVQKVAQAIKAQVEENLKGVTINLQSMAKAERLDKMQKDNYEVALTRWGPDYADPMTYMGMWVTNNANNYGFWSNAEYDKLIADCTTGAYVSDYAQRWAKLLEAEKIVMDNAVIAPLYTKANANLIASNVKGVEFHPVAINRIYNSATKTVG